MKKNIDLDLVSLIAEYMEKGFLENIIDMFKHDAGLYDLIGELIQDERVRVRIGITALMEEMKRIDRDNLSRAVSNLLPLLENTGPVIQGDVTNLLGIIGDKAALPHIEKMLSNENQSVQLLAKEAIEEIKKEGC